MVEGIGEIGAHQAERDGRSGRQPTGKRQRLVKLSLGEGLDVPSPTEDGLRQLAQFFLFSHSNLSTLAVVDGV